MAWRCPDCKRSFGRKNQSHSCAPAGTVDDYFADRPPVLRPAYNAIEKHVLAMRDVHVDPVNVCIMFKRERSFAEVRAKRDCIVLCFLLSRVVDDPKITKTLRLSAHRTAHFVDIEKPSDVDRDVRDWLSEAYASSPT